MLSNNDTTLSKTIMFLRFPLIIAVVFIHTNNQIFIKDSLLAHENQFPTYNLIHHIITNELSQIAVPLFFFISGFLFFYHSDFNMEAYTHKLKKRFRTLLIPYIFWNVAVLFMTLLNQFMTPGKQMLIVGYNWIDWLNLFWNHNGMPICYQFWYIRDLIVVIFFTPILYYLVRYFKVYGVILLGCLWLFNLWFVIHGASITAFFFFSFGAWFSINRRDFTIDFLKIRWLMTFCYLFMLILNTWLWSHQITNFPFLHNIGIIIGLIAAISWAAYAIKSNHIHPNAFLAGSSFFVYAYHGMPTACACKCWILLLSPVNEWTMLAGYIIIPFTIAGIGVGIYALLRKYFPTFTALITGGR